MRKASSKKSLTCTNGVAGDALHLMQLLFRNVWQKLITNGRRPNIFLQAQAHLLPSILSASQRTSGLRATQESHLACESSPGSVGPFPSRRLLLSKRRCSKTALLDNGRALVELEKLQGSRAAEAATTRSLELDRATHLHSVQNGLDLCIIQPRQVCFRGRLPAP